MEEPVGVWKRGRGAEEVQVAVVGWEMGYGDGFRAGLRTAEDRRRKQRFYD